jgi:hypothetical protein
MAGESWRQIFQIGKEVTDSTPVAATRKLYLAGNITRERAVHLVEVNTGTRSRVVDAKARSVVAGGSVNQPISADEILELLYMGVTATPTTTSQASPTPTVQPASFTNATTGGTIAAGVISARYTIVTPAGESQPLNVVATTTTTTGASTVTLGAVTPLPTGTTAVRYYITAPGAAVTTATYAGTNATGASITLTAPGDGVTLPPSATPGPVYTWVFAPSDLQPCTLEFNDGYNAWQETGVKANTVHIAGSVGADTIVTCDLFGTEAVYSGQPGATFSGMTPALTDRTPDFISGWETKVYIDPFGGTPGSTVMQHALTAWDFTLTNNLARKYFADDTVATGKVTVGALAVAGTFTIEGDSHGLAEYLNRENAVKRVVRLEFGNNRSAGTGTAMKKIWVDIPGAWTTVDLTPEDQNTKVFRFGYNYVYDPTNAFPIRYTVVNARSTAF